MNEQCLHDEHAALIVVVVIIVFCIGDAASRKRNTNCSRENIAITRNFAISLREVEQFVVGAARDFQRVTRSASLFDRSITKDFCQILDDYRQSIDSQP
jgi:hypothetical protein